MVNQVPHASVAVAEFIPFQNKIQVTAATGYSQFSNIVGMYPVLAFGKDVDLEEEPDKVYQFIVDNFTETSVDLPAYAINSIPNLPADITLAFNDLTNPSVTIPVDENSQLRMLMRDATATPLLTTTQLLAPQPGPPLVTTGYSLGKYIGSSGGGGLSIPTVNWADSDFNTNGHGGDFYLGIGAQIQNRTLFSGDGMRMIVANSTNTSSGWCRVYDHNNETNEWGKFDASGSFTKDEYHSLDKSGTHGHYANGCTISADGKTIVLGGYLDHYRGCAFVWQYDESTAEWGKWNTDGSFSTGEAHDLSSNTLPSTTWPDGHPYCRYGYNCLLYTSPSPRDRG